MEPIFCPLLKDDCQGILKTAGGSGCSWWDNKKRQCAILTIAAKKRFSGKAAKSHIGNYNWNIDLEEIG